jgi:hypothetical protein
MLSVYILDSVKRRLTDEQIMNWKGFGREWLCPNPGTILTFVCKVKGKKLSLYLIKHHAMKTYREWRYSSTTPDLGTRWR